MKDKKVLLIGTSFSAVPLLQYLKSLGCRVAVCGGYETDPCHSYADESFYVNYSDQEELLKLCNEQQFDYIVPSCNDYAYNSASYVSSKLNKFYGFDDFDITNILHTKNAFRDFTYKNNLSVPKAIKYEYKLKLNELTLNYPLLVKPDLSSSGKGVSKIENNFNFDYAIEIAKINSENGEVVIEEFVEGNLYSHSAFVQDGKILIDFFVDEFCTVYPYQVDSSCLSYNLSDSLKSKVREDIQKLVKLLNLADGLLHTQFIADGEKFWLIETMRRCPGDLYGSLIAKSTNFNYVEFYVKPFLNQKNNTTNLNFDPKYIARHTISSDHDLIFKSLKFELKSEKLDFFTLKESGNLLKQAPYDKVGIAFYEFDTQDELMKNAKKMKDFFKVEIYEGVISE